MTHHLHALVIQLLAQESGVLPVLGGELAHAAFYAAVQSVDPVLSAQMHDAQERSAFSLSPLYGFWRSPGDGRIKVNAGHPGWVKTDLGGEMAPMELVDGAKTAIALALLPDDGPTGGYVHLGKPLPW